MHKKLLIFLLVLCLAVGATPTMVAGAMSSSASYDDCLVYDDDYQPECSDSFFIVIFFFDPCTCDDCAFFLLLLDKIQLDPYWLAYKGQSSPNAITQAGNLFMFVMHNPVRWRDPSGLFAIPFNSNMNINIAGKFAGLFGSMIQPPYVPTIDDCGGGSATQNVPLPHIPSG